MLDLENAIQEIYFTKHTEPFYTEKTKKNKLHTYFSMLKPKETWKLNDLFCKKKDRTIRTRIAPDIYWVG